jgi:hypothetical protein
VINRNKECSLVLAEKKKNVLLRMNKKVTKNMSKNEPPNLVTTSMDMKFIKTRMPEEGNKVRWQKYGK